MDKINSELIPEKEGYEVTSCLVNKFEGAKSSLAEHCDDEASINPQSSIFTLSVGATRTITFRDRFSDEEIRHVAGSGSMYAMSRDSQCVFRHRIDPDPSCNATRYSLTFRCVNWKYRNSTCLHGDSNTTPIEFGEGKGKVGALTPGKQVYEPRIHMIDPMCSASFANVVLHVGVNDLKQEEVKNTRDVEAVYEKFKSKVFDIVELNPKVKLIVFPVLPTGSEVLNMRVLDYNRLITNDLPRSCCNVSVVDGVQRFLGNARFAGCSPRNLLSESLTRKRGDVLHINEAGCALLVSLMKDAIRSRRGGFRDSRRYGTVAKAGGKSGRTS